MQKQHWDQLLGRGCCQPSQIPHWVLGVLPVQLSDADYDQLSSFPVFQSQYQLYLFKTLLRPL